MKQWAEKIKSLLDRRIAVLISLLLAIVSKSVIAFAYTSLKGDKALYLLLTKGLLQTGRMVEPVRVAETGVTVYVYEPAIHSPFYSLLAAPVLWVTDSYFQTQAVLSIVSWALFYAALYAVAKLVLRHRWMATIFILCSAFFLYPHELSSPVKDTFAAGLALASVVLMHRWLQQPRWQITGWLSLSLLALALVKLLYIPLVAVLVFLLFVSVLLKKSRQHYGYFVLLVGLLLLGGFLTNQLVLQPAKAVAELSHVRLPSNTTDLTVGFSPENLLATFPFVSSSVVNTHLWAVQLERLTDISFTTIMRNFLYLDALVLLFLFITSLYYSRQLLEGTNVLLFLIIASFTMAAVVVMLSLTGHVVQYKSGGAPWTYVMDARSFLLPMLVLQLLTFRFVVSMRRLPALRMLLVALCFLTLAHGFYFTVKELGATIAGTKQQPKNDSHDSIKALLTQPVPVKTSLVTSDNFLRRYIQVNNLPAYALSSLPPDFSWMKKGERFIIATYPEDSLLLKKFPTGQLQLLDSLPPFRLHSYEVKQ